MKPLHIVLLIVAGALGGALITRVWQKPAAPAPAVAHVESTAPAAARPEAPPPVAELAPPPAVPPERPITHQRPVTHERPAQHDVIPLQRVHQGPPPAHPRPLQLGDAVPLPPSVSEPAPQAAPPAMSDPAPVSSSAAAPVVTAPAPPAQPAPAPPPPTEPHKVTLSAGLLIPVRLVDSLSSARNAAGDTFTATLDHELVVDGFVIAERGAKVEGRVVAATPGSKVKGNAALSVELTRLHTADGQDVTIQTESFERRAEPDHQKDALKVGGGAILGAIIGGIAGGGKGAAIGAGAGGGAGAGDVMLTRKPATLPSETRVSFRLRAPVTLTEKRG